MLNASSDKRKMPEATNTQKPGLHRREIAVLEDRLDERLQSGGVLLIRISRWAGNPGGGTTYGSHVAVVVPLIQAAERELMMSVLLTTAHCCY